MLRELADMSYMPAFHCGKDANGTAISLVTTAYLYTEQDFSVLDTVLYCITATADSITVTDYRDALGDFATAIKNYLL